MAYRILIFMLGSAGIIWILHSSFRNIHQHGFYRFLAWGITLKSINWIGIFIAVSITGLLTITAKIEEMN